MKKLIVFYSLSGKTRKMAEKIKEKTGADILELKPVKEIKNTGFSKYFWGGMQVMMKKTPELKKYEINLNDYNCLIMGTPVWAFTFAPPLKTFMAENQIKNKKIALFASHEGGPKDTFEKWENALVGNEIIAKTDWNSKNNFNSIDIELDKFCEEINKIS